MNRAALEAFRDAWRQAGKETGQPFAAVPVTHGQVLFALTALLDLPTQVPLPLPTNRHDDGHAHVWVCQACGITMARR